jgi:hypothetical protein
MKPFLFCLFIYLSHILISCSSTKKSVSSSIFHLPDSLPALPQSEIDLPLKINARAILFKANFLLPGEFTSEGWPNYSQPSCDFRYKYRFVRSGFTISCVNNILGVQLSGSYQVAGAKCLCSMNKPVSPWISGSCGFGKEPLRHVNINVNSRLSFLPNFKILTTTSPGKIDAPDKCYVSLFSSDVTQQVLDSIRASVQSFCTTLDATISGMDFSHLVTQSIGKGFRKSAINNYGYLVINPSSIHIGQLNYVKDSFSISIGLTCKPQMSSDSVNLEIGEVHVPVSVGENLDNVSAYVDANYDYHFLSKLLSDTLKNRVFEYKGRTIVIKDAAIKGVGNHQVEVRIDFSGTNKGRLYLRGTPILDTLKQILTVPDISYSLESGDLALKIGKSLFSNKIKKTLKGNSYLDIAALIRSNRAVLDSMVNRKIDNNFTLGGKINEVRIVGLLPQNNYLQAQIHVIAKLAILSNGSF